MNIQTVLSNKKYYDSPIIYFLNYTTEYLERSYCMPFLEAFKFYIDICTLPKASGLCEETLPRWYFDYTETRCMPFNYTGCDGNANRLNLLRYTRASTQNICALPKTTGNCTDYQEKYYYDIFEGKCQGFIYGGCSGNENNFNTVEECKVTCEDKGISTDPEIFPTGVQG
ncbi:PI-actitoxin-Aeq3a [Armadillidium vulgare]|nr:PI-actitoxin-Aeq3a [Armadillidium vulgare]